MAPGASLNSLSRSERLGQRELSQQTLHLDNRRHPVSTGGCTGWEMAVEIESDIYGKTFHKLWEREPVPTAASMIRDAVHLATMGRQASL